MTSAKSFEPIKCDHCDIHTSKLQEINGKEVCRDCKKDFEKNGSFTRAKVSHDYDDAEVMVKKLQSRPKIRYNKRRDKHGRTKRTKEAMEKH